MKLGTWGEQVAAKYLQAHGYSILEQNFSCRKGELDLIACDGETIVFVEVKTRRSLIYGLPCQSITEQKKQHILQAIKYFVMVRGLENRELRIDVIEILVKDKSAYVHHIKNAF